MEKTHKIKQTDIVVSIGHDNLIANVIGFAREVVNESDTSGVLIFIPSESSKSLLDLIKVMP